MGGNLPCSHIPCHLEETPPAPHRPDPGLHRHNPDVGLDVATTDQVECRGRVCVCVCVSRRGGGAAGGWGLWGVGGTSIQLHHLSLVNEPRFSKHANADSRHLYQLM